MKTQQTLVSLGIFLLLIIVSIFGFFYLTSSLTDPSDSSTVLKKGPHQGKLLGKEAFQVEVTLVESKSTPPKFKIYFYTDEKLILPSEVTYEMELKRINRLEHIPFIQKENALESTVEIVEPHSFEVNITATYQNKTYHWTYDSYENRLELNPETLQANKIKIETAGPINLQIQLEAAGKIMPNEELTVYISPRFPGVVKAVNKKLGDDVQKGEVLAVIESNESLRNYEVKSELNGTVIKKEINLGMSLSGQETIFVISDLQSVWADFTIYSQDLSRIKIGNPIEIISLDGRLKQQARIDYISPFGNESTQSLIARSILSSPHSDWKPGLFISGLITVEQISIPVGIKDQALQTFKEEDVVFISVNHLFEMATVQLGRRHKEWVEVKSGLLAGEKYVSENSFILKADLEKSGAKHEH